MYVFCLLIVKSKLLFVGLFFGGSCFGVWVLVVRCLLYVVCCMLFVVLDSRLLIIVC